MGEEGPKPADARPIERERKPDARKRWEAWEHWWPRSGPVRRDFMRREMAFAAKNHAMVDAAAADGVAISASDWVAGDDDPEAQKRVEKFQMWYCGAQESDDDEDEIFDEAALDDEFGDFFAEPEPLEDDEEAAAEDAPVFERGSRAKAQKEKAHKAKFKAAKKDAPPPAWTAAAAR